MATPLCPGCLQPIDAGGSFCKHCGKKLSNTPPPPPGLKKDKSDVVPPTAAKRRPDGISVLAVLIVIMGVAMLLIGIGISAMSPEIYDIATEQNPDALPFSKDAWNSIAQICMISGAALATLCFITAMGLWALRKWARYLGMILSVVLMIFAFPVGTILGIIMLWYLWKKDIREAFAQQ